MKDKDRYIVRFPDGMREKVKESAARNCRTINAEIIFHLESALSVAPAVVDDQATARRTPEGPAQ